MDCGTSMSTYYLKAAALAYNSAKQTQGVGRSKGELTLQDFDNLSPEQMVQIIVCLLSEFDSSLADLTSSKCSSILPYSDIFGVPGGLVYDSIADYVYSKAKKFFPDGDDLFDISVLLVPAKDPKRTKQVIVYLTTFFLFVDQAEVHGTFQDEWNRLNDENKEKSELYYEIDTIKSNIAETIQKMQEKEDMKPQLEKDVAAVDEDIRREQEKLDKLEAIAKKESKIYENMSANNKKLEAELLALDAEKLSLESQIVHGAAEVTEAYNKEKQQLKKDNALRESLGEDLKNVGNQEQFLQEMIEKTINAVQRFEKLIGNMQAAGESLTIINRGMSKHKTKVKELEAVKMACNKLVSQRHGIEKEHQNRCTVHEEKLSELAELNSRMEDGTGRLISDYKENESMINVMSNKIAVLEEQIRSLNIEIKMHRDYADNFPKRVAELLANGTEMWNKLNAHCDSVGLGLGVTIEKK